MKKPLVRAGLACAALFTLGAGPAHANEAAALEQLRNTTFALIEALVTQGLLTRERADALLAQARTPLPAAAPAPGAAAGAAGVPAPGQWGTPATPPTVSTGANGRTVQRVPFLSETVRNELRESIKLDVLEQARAEGWADSRQIPAWARRFTLGGDVRVRLQSERFGSGNLPAEDYRLQNELASTPAWAPDLLNTTNDRDRLTLRARLELGMRAGDDTTAGLRLSTGTTSGPGSSSTTLGNNFNRQTVVIDRAFVRWEPRFDMRFTAGRMAVPFFGTDLAWPDDLSLDGVAAQGDITLASGLFAFASAGAFPLQEFAVDKRDKWLYGVQAGIDWTPDDVWNLRAALGVYDFQRIEGVREIQPPPTGPRAGTVPYLTSEYPASARQKGNTLINLNDPTSTAAPVWGLASRFRPVNLSLGLTYKAWLPYELGLTFDYLRNTGFDVADIERRALDARVRLVAEKTRGLQLRGTFGVPRLEEKGQWQLFAALRQFERDAWPDAFTDTTWHGGGTSYKGWALGGSWALDRSASLGLRWTSTRNLDDGVVSPFAPGGTLSSAPLRIEVLQMDLNARF